MHPTTHLSYLTKRLRCQASILFATLFLSACASPVPEQIRQPGVSNLTPDEARQQPATFTTQAVRWGGQIIKVVNKPEFTELIVLARPLDKDGEPQSVRNHQGRFIARVNHFLEPSLYSAGRDLTVVGTFNGTVEKMIGEYPYQYPLVHAEHIHLWPEPIQTEADYWDDPWYPWGPWGPWHPWHHH